jgi:hypothetical protein
MTIVQVMKPVLTPVRHNPKRKHKSLDSQTGQLNLQMPTRFDHKINPGCIRLQQCVIDGVIALATIQEKHKQLADAIS